MSQLANQLYRHGRTLRQMERIIFVVRNPYYLVSSNYNFLREQAASGSNNENAMMAASTSFDQFCHKLRHPDPSNWLKLDGKILPNMHIVRFESLDADIADLDLSIGAAKTSLVHLNKSKNEIENKNEFSDETEKIVYEKYKILFDLGHYSRREGI